MSGEEKRSLELIYETRVHSSGRCSSNYPPQHSSASVEGGKSSFLSFLSPRSGLSKIKERWGGYSKSNKRTTRPASLFISPGGERVAIATGNQITFLRKDDDFQHPCGIFTCNGVGTFTYGVWSECHDVLGVVDDGDTIYFIKLNGDEIIRTTKKQLNTSFPVIGLIPLDGSDGQGSCLCSFATVTSDGSLHSIEVGREPNVSMSSIHASNGALTSKKQFPHDIFCIDYHHEHSLFVVVGGSGSTLLASNGNSASSYLTLWHRSGNLDLDFLCTAQFEGVYYKPKDYVGQSMHAKVLMSPQGKFIASSDTIGCLHIFELDKESFSVSTFVSREISGSQATRNLLNCQKELLSNVVDFAWWSDHILTIVKMDGTIHMLDILTGLKCQEKDLVCLLPVLDRIQNLEGHIFMLECKSSKERLAPYENDDFSGLSNIEQFSGDRWKQFYSSQCSWILRSISQRSVPEMYSLLIRKHEYQLALEFADRNGLDRDVIFKSQWLHSPHGIHEINMFLSKIRDRVFVLSECVDKVGQTEDVVKALLAHGLHATEKFRFSQPEDQKDSKVWDYRIARLQLLLFRDRLETYLGINMGRFSVQEYTKFRSMPLSEAALTLAESGKIGALNLLFKRHPYSLSPSMLQILAAIPETIPVQTYRQLLPGESPSLSFALREEDWVECDDMVSFMNKLPDNNVISTQIRTEPIIKRHVGYIWPSTVELATWYKSRARDIDCYTGQLDNCLCLVDLACRRNIELQRFHEDLLYLHQLIYAEENDGDICFNISLVAWENLSDYKKFRMMLTGAKEENIIKRLHDRAIPFMKSRLNNTSSAPRDHVAVGDLFSDPEDESFLVRWLKEIALENKLDICLKVIEEGCKELQYNLYFKDEIELVDCALQCIFLCTVTDRWSTMSTILSKLPQKQDAKMDIEGLEKRIKVAEGHVEAGRLLAFYQVPKPTSFFVEAHADEKGVKQILRLIFSKFVRRQPGRSDNDWANLWYDMQSLQEKAFPFLDPEFMLMEFCRGLLKAGKFSLARNYLKGTGSVPLATEKAENLVIQAAREYFFSASSLSCAEIWKAKECLNLFSSSRNVKAEADIIDALTVKLPYLGVTILPVQFRQIKDPMEIIKMVITNQAGAYLHVEEIIEIANLLGLNSLDDISAVEEAIAREAAVAGDLQLAFDLCLGLARKGHGVIWDLCVALARGPALENMDIRSRKQFLGFALSHCDEESIGELLQAWKDIDMEGQCETVSTMSGTIYPNSPGQGSLTMSLPVYGIKDMVDPKDSLSGLVGGTNCNDEQVYFRKIKNVLSLVAKSLPMVNITDMETLLRDNAKVSSFASLQLPWLFELSNNADNGERLVSDFIPGSQYMNIHTQALITILSWLARNGFVPKDTVISSLAKSIIEPPVTEQEDVIGCSFLLNLVDAFNGVEVIEEQLRLRENYQDICSIMNVGMTYSLLHNSAVECKEPTQRRELLLKKFKEKHTALTSDDINKIDKEQSTFWKEWKLKLEEKKQVAERSRVLEHVIPGVDTNRFLSGDIDYIRGAVFSLIESVKLEKKCILKDLLKLADTYGLNRCEVLLRYLSSILVSDVWTNEDVGQEISEFREEIICNAFETVKTISLVVYPALDGPNKQRLACIYSLLSDCYSRLEQTKQSLPIVHFLSSHLSALELAHLYRVLEQECKKISSIKELNFKNIAGLNGLNVESFHNEVYAHINNTTLEDLANMVRTLVAFYSGSMPEGLISWQDVYKYHVQNLLGKLRSRAGKEFDVGNPEMFQEFVYQVEQSFDFCKTYIKHLPPEDAIDILKQYMMVMIPQHGYHGNIPDNSTWQECFISLLNFWIKLTHEMGVVTSSESSELRFNPEFLVISLKVLKRLVMEDSVSPSQGWATVVGYLAHGIMGDFAVELPILCRAMIFSGCWFGAISEVFSEAMSDPAATVAVDVESLDLPTIYVNILQPILEQLVSGSPEHQNFHYLLSSLSKLEGQIEQLQRVRHVVWEQMAQFSDNLQLPSHVRVYVLELMQYITGRSINGFTTELQSNVLPWEGWDELLLSRSESTNSHRLLDQRENSSNFTSTLVALRSSQLVSVISPSIEITPDDLLNVETAVSCFSKLCEASKTDKHFDALIAILEEWEGYFHIEKDEKDSPKVSDEEDNWNNDGWDEGWESFQELESPKKEKTENSLQIVPLNKCWMEILRKLASVSRFNYMLRLIDQSLLNSYGVLLDEDDSRSLTQVLLEVDCFLALELALLLPYEAVQLHCCDVMEQKLKEGGVIDTKAKDHELLMLVLSSGVLSTIISHSSYGTIFSYICYLVGNFAHQCQETQLSPRHSMEDNSLLLFRRILFPCFISELVKADQQILAGFIITKFMHTNAALNLINISEATLTRYMDRQLQALQHNAFIPEDINSCQMLKNSVSRLRSKLGDLIRSSLALLPNIRRG